MFDRLQRLYRVRRQVLADQQRRHEVAHKQSQRLRRVDL